jgi:hypothetical protein
MQHFFILYFAIRTRYNATFAFFIAYYNIFITFTTRLNYILLITAYSVNFIIYYTILYITTYLFKITT